jgi:hypothetical protein
MAIAVVYRPPDRRSAARHQKPVPRSGKSPAFHVQLSAASVDESARSRGEGNEEASH